MEEVFDKNGNILELSESEHGELVIRTYKKNQVIAELVFDRDGVDRISEALVSLGFMTKVEPEE